VPLRWLKRNRLQCRSRLRADFAEPAPADIGADTFLKAGASSLDAIFAHDSSSDYPLGVDNRKVPEPLLIEIDIASFAFGST